MPLLVAVPSLNKLGSLAVVGLLCKPGSAGRRGMINNMAGGVIVTKARRRVLMAAIVK